MKIRHEVTSKGRKTKAYLRTTTTSYLEAKTCEPCSTYINMVYGRPILIFPSITHYIQIMNITQTHIIHTYNNNVYKNTDIDL